MSRHRKSKDEFKLRIQLGPTMADQFDLAEALQSVVSAIERGDRRGSISDRTNSKVGEFSFTGD